MLEWITKTIRVQYSIIIRKHVIPALRCNRNVDLMSRNSIVRRNVGSLNSEYFPTTLGEAL